MDPILQKSNKKQKKKKKTIARSSTISTLFPVKIGSNGTKPVSRFEFDTLEEKSRRFTVRPPWIVSSFTPMLRYTMWRWTTATLCCLPAFFPLSEHPRLSFSALGREREREGENSTRNRGRNLRSLVCVGSSIRHVPWIPLIPYSVYEPAKFSKERGNRICRIISRETLLLLILLLLLSSWFTFFQPALGISLSLFLLFRRRMEIDHQRSRNIFSFIYSLYPILSRDWYWGEFCSF